MIIKVAKDALNFTMIDDIAGAIQVSEIEGQEKIIGSLPKDNRIFKVVAHINGEEKAGIVGHCGPMVIEYQNKLGEWCSIWFNNATAYICSDSGKTIEAIRA